MITYRRVSRMESVGNKCLEILNHWREQLDTWKMRNLLWRIFRPV